MIINVSFDGRKLFNWEGGTAEATKIEEDVGEVAGFGQYEPGDAMAIDARQNRGERRLGFFRQSRTRNDDRDCGAAGAPNPSPGSSWPLPRLPRSIEFQF
jgi:hypothetical protein